MTATDTPRPPARTAQRVVEALTAYGVEYVFGIPGAKIDAVFDALADMGPQLVVCRHEQNAAFMAGAVGRLTGTPGVVLVTSGPGTTNLATGLLTADTEQDPVVALCGAVSREDRLKRTHQSMDAAAMMKTVTKFTGEVNDPDNVPEAVTNAFRAATTAPQSATTGSCSVLAVSRPVARFAVPGPEVTSTTPGVPVSRPIAPAMNAAFCSWRHTTT